jgi:hypothetical protein
LEAFLKYIFFISRVWPEYAVITLTLNLPVKRFRKMPEYTAENHTSTTTAYPKTASHKTSEGTGRGGGLRSSEAPHYQRFDNKTDHELVTH